ncbi:flagellar hook-length control protein FliK [bacterium BFN5]|nr:flagellar hook-length control protein FliK [bacterium BFN5]
MDAAIAGKQGDKSKAAFESTDIGEEDTEIDSSTAESQSSTIPMMAFASIVIPQIIPQVITQVVPTATPVMQNIETVSTDQSGAQGAAALSPTMPSQNQVAKTTKQSDFLMASNPETKSVEVPDISDPASFVQIQEQPNVSATSKAMSDQAASNQSDGATVISATSFGVEVTQMMQPNSKDKSSVRAEPSIPEKAAITTEDTKDGVGHDVLVNSGVGSISSEHNSDEFAPVKVPSVSPVPKEKADDAHETETFTTNNKLFSDAVSSPKETKHNENVFSEVLQQRTSSIEPKTYVNDTKNATSQFVKDTHQITSQIVEQAQVLKNNQETQMIIKLKPEHLGELTLKVTVDSGVVSASFHSDSAEVRSVIESSLVQLKQEMSNQGLKVDNVGVYAGLGQFLSNGQREAPQQPTVKLKNKRTGEEAFEESEKVVNSLKPTTETGVDYRI